MKINYITLKLILLFLLASIFNAQSQNENNFWYFGNNAGIDFSTGAAVSTTGSLFTYEGCASISTGGGSLLFYTDGITVFNKTGVIMTNGSGLFGNPSSTSSAIIVPKPCSNIEYFIFTVDYVGGSNGVNYSLVNMDDDNDGVYEPLTENGRIVTGIKNINLPGPTGERICAVKHANEVDYWVTTTQMNTNIFYTYLVTNSGVSAPIVQPLGPVISAGFYMKFSPDSTKMARTNHSSQDVYIYDFDNTTGQLSSPQFVGAVPINAYGIEFSPDSQKLFYSDLANGNGTGVGGIYEVVVSPSLGTPSLIANVPNQGGRYAVGALQQSPVDPNIIYAAMDGENFIGEIDIAASSFNRTAVPLTNTCYLGLPTFVSGQISTSCLNLEPYVNAVPTLFPATIKNELTSGGWPCKDKEYGDFDNDGDIDILYTKIDGNSDITLHVLINNAGSGNPPNYTLPSIQLAVLGPQVVEYSFRLIDWDNDNYNDVIVHGHNGGTYLYINNQSIGLNTGIMMLNGGADYPSLAGTSQFISVGDLNNDGFPDLLISSQSKFFGTVYFENNMTNTYPYFDLELPQDYIGNSIINPFISDDNGSYQIPEIYDADCDGDNDVFISDPLFGAPNTNGARVLYHENNGGITTNMLPNINTVGIENQFGFLNDNIPISDLGNDFIITRIVDYFGTGCPIAIAFNPHNQNTSNPEFYYYDQDCSCQGILGVADAEGAVNELDIRLYPNPSSGVFSLQNNSVESIQRVEIYSINGAKVKSFINASSFEISDLTKGLYLVQIHTEKSILTKKLIKD